MGTCIRRRAKGLNLSIFSARLYGLARVSDLGEASLTRTALDAWATSRAILSYFKVLPTLDDLLADIVDMSKPGLAGADLIAFRFAMRITVITFGTTHLNFLAFLALLNSLTAVANLSLSWWAHTNLMACFLT